MERGQDVKPRRVFPARMVRRGKYRISTWERYGSVTQVTSYILM